MSNSPPFVSTATWDVERPRVLVIACSDGRLQEAVDEFLASLGILRYDRLYVPGGPGALASSGIDYLRSGQLRKECAFLVEAHQIEEAILLFHGPALGGPEHAICADYHRKLLVATPEKARAQQLADIAEILRESFGWRREVRVRIFCAEVRKDRRVTFAPIPI